MTTFIKRVALSPWFIVLASLLVVVVTYVLGDTYKIERSEWPGWVQAVGSVAAILVAVWVPWQQGESQRKQEEDRERAEVAGLLRSLRAEIESTMSVAEAEIAPIFEKSAPGQPIFNVFPLVEDPFPIYAAVLPKLGLIPNDALRNQIVKTYSAAKGCVLTIRFHNNLIRLLEAAIERDAAEQTEASKMSLQQRRADVGGYSGSVRASFYEAKAAIEALFEALRAV